MKKLIALLLCVVMLLPILIGCGGSGENGKTKIESFSVGYARADISPKGSVPLAGFGDSEERFSNSVMDPLYATCVAFADTEGNKVLMFGLDLLHTEGTLTGVTRQLIAEETGVPFSHIMFSASHTHSGTDQGISAIPTVAASNEAFTQVCLQAAKDALADLKPAKMYGTFARPEGLNYVRHYILSDGTYRAKEVGTLPKDQVYGHMWKADNLLQMIKFTREGGKDMVLINWQAHYYGTKKVNYNGISADYPGSLRAELESQLDCYAAFVLGGSGNVNCTSQIPTENHDKGYIEHGKMLAAAAIEASANMQELETGTIYLEENMYVVPTTLKENPLYAFGFGDFGIVFSPWEIFDVHAKGVREASKYTYTFYASCANASYGNRYLPHEAAFGYYCYETGTTRYPAGTAELIQEVLTGMINTCFEKSGQTQKERAEGYMSTPIAPVCDDKVYTNPVPGDASVIQQTANGHYPMTLLEGTNVKRIVADTLEVAQQIVERTTMKLLLDERNIVVGVVD